jgi:superfamily II DNA or RNA helicase
MILRSKQLELNGACTSEARKGYKSILIQAATGFGKSVCATAQIQTALSRGKKCAFVVPKRDLVRQMSATFSDFNIPHSFVAAGYQFNPFSSVHICTAGSLVNRLDKISPDVVFIDETHVGAGQLDKIIKHYKAKGAWIIGLSATPTRLDGRGLNCWYDTMVRGPSIRWLIDNKFLSDYRLFQPSIPDLSGIKTVGGDFAKGELNKRMMEDRVLIGNAVSHYKSHALGKANVTFCTSILHSELVCEAFNAGGVPAKTIDGTMSDAERRALIRSFAMREILVLCSVDLLHTGFDLASNAGMPVTVECMSDLRPTKSLALQLQKWGRVLRYKESPAIIFDHAGNCMNADGTMNHGFPCMEREWTLESVVKSKKEMSERSSPIKQCEKCFFVHPPAPQCPNCGNVYEVQSRLVDTIDGELVELSPDQIRQKARTEQGLARTLDDLIAIGKSRGYKNPEFWAAKVASGRNIK